MSAVTEGVPPEKGYEQLRTTLRELAVETMFRGIVSLPLLVEAGAKVDRQADLTRLTRSLDLFEAAPIATEGFRTQSFASAVAGSRSAWVVCHRTSRSGCWWEIGGRCWAISFARSMMSLPSRSLSELLSNARM